MLTFARPELLWLLLALPLWLFLRGRKGGAATLRYSSTQLARAAARPSRWRVLGFAPLLRALAATFLVLALARPQVTHATTRVHESGIDIMLAVDVSTSMEAADMGDRAQRETRLLAVKQVVAKFIEARPNDRIGLVAFAGAPYLVSPLTLDHDWLIQNLDRLETGMVEDGTAIGSALATSVDRLTKESAGTPRGSRIAVLLTDGVNNAGSIQPSLAAETAKSLGVKVYAVGVGVSGEALLPLRDDKGRTRMVRTQVDVDEDTLRKIADTTSGKFFRATDTASLAKVYAEIDRMEATPRTLEHLSSVDERYASFLLPGIGLLGLELLLAFVLRRRIP